MILYSHKIKHRKNKEKTKKKHKNEGEENENEGMKEMDGSLYVYYNSDKPEICRIEWKNL